jgi:alpha-1,3-rhamnosyltransferase
MNQPDKGLPLVSVIIPAFNHEQYVEQAINSVLTQTYPAVEMLVIDDASTDGTAGIAEKLARQHGFKFIRNVENIGLNPTLEKGIHLSRGAYLSILASDDWIPPAKIEEQVELIASGGLDAIYGTGWSVEGQDATLIDLGDLEAEFVEGTILDRLYTDSSHAPLLQSALIRRKPLIELLGDRRRFKSDDWVTLIRLVERYKVGFHNKPWFYYRQHSANTYRDYWFTLPIKTEVISLVSPESYRARGLSNMLREQAQFLYMDRKRGLATKFLLSSMMLNPSIAGWTRLIAQLMHRVARRAIRRVTGRVG